MPQKWNLCVGGNEEKAEFGATNKECQNCFEKNYAGLQVAILKNY